MGSDENTAPASRRPLSDIVDALSEEAAEPSSRLGAALNNAFYTNSPARMRELQEALRHRGAGVGADATPRAQAGEAQACEAARARTPALPAAVRAATEEPK